MTHLSPSERYEIAAYNSQDIGKNEIARLLGRSPSTISRELRRNATLVGGYQADQAQACAVARRHQASSLPRKLSEKMRREIEQDLRIGYSPDVITGDHKKQGKEMVSGQTIYTLVYRDYAEGGTLWTLLAQRHRKQKKRRKIPSTRGQIPNRVMITERPADVEERTVIGDWEGDTICGVRNRGGVLTLIDRRSRYILTVRLDERTAKATAEALCSVLKNQEVRSLTVDNGKEFTHHALVSKGLKIPVYFAEPYSPWQRGSNENGNGLLRRYYPKGVDFRNVSDEQIALTTLLLNNRPRKILGYATPWEVYSGKANPPDPVAFQT